MKELVRRFILVVGQSNLARVTFFRMPTKFRIYVRNLLISENTAEQNTFTQVENQLIQELLNIEWNEDALKNLKETKWLEPNTPSPKIGDIEIDAHQKSQNCKIVTSDYWDTLVGRIQPAETVKRAVALKLSLLEWEKRSYKGARISASEIHEKRLAIEHHQVANNGEAVLNRVILKLLEHFNCPDFQNQLIAFELDLEKEISFLLPSSTNILNLANDKKVDFQIISDFYLSKDMFRQITPNTDLNEVFEEIKSSADYGFTKRDNGKLFERVIPNDARNRWLHFGDNELSDIRNAQSAGANTVFVRRTGTTAWNQFECNYSALAREAPEHFSTNSETSFLIDLLAVGYSTVSFAVEQALLQGLNQIGYLSREGETLYKIHDFLHKEKVSPFEAVAPIYIPFGRATVYGPSYSNSLDGGLLKVSEQYPLMDSKAFIETLALPDHIAERVRQELSPLEKHRTTSISKKLSDSLRTAITEYLVEQRGLIFDFLTNLKVSARNTLFADLGWRGTIQDSISRILGEETSGAYLGLNSPFFGKAEGQKRGLLFDEPLGQKPPTWMAFIGPIERAFTLSDYQTMRLAKISTLGEQIELIKSTESDGPSPGRRKLVEENFENYLPFVVKLFSDLGIFGHETRDYVAGTLERWMNNPNPLHSSTWFDEKHREGFGAGTDVHYSTISPSIHWQNSSTSSLVRNAVRLSRWPSGYRAWIPVQTLLLKGNENE